MLKTRLKKFGKSIREMVSLDMVERGDNMEHIISNKYEIKYYQIAEIKKEIERLEQEIENLANDQNPNNVNAKLHVLLSEKEEFRKKAELIWESKTEAYRDKIITAIEQKQDISQLGEKYEQGLRRIRLMVSKYKELKSCVAELLGIEYEFLGHVSSKTPLTNREMEQYGSEYVKKRRKEIEKFILHSEINRNPNTPISDEQKQLLQDRSIRPIQEFDIDLQLGSLLEDPNRVLDNLIVRLFDNSKIRTANLLGRTKVHTILSPSRIREKKKEKSR